MSRLRLLLLLTGLGALFTGGPVGALVAPAPEGTPLPIAARSVAAMSLLQSAARAARTRSWSGTQHVVSTRAGEPRFTVLQIRHVPGAGSEVRVLYSQDPAVTAADGLDEKLLVLLARHYDLRVVGVQRCSGRRAKLVEALRPDESGARAVAGRFWVDEATGLVVRRDVLDEDGEIVRSSAFVSLRLSLGAGAPALAAGSAEVVRPRGERLSDAELAALEAQGYPVATELPTGLELFEARMHDSDRGDVLQLSYSDGLSTLSLFVQKGELPRVSAGAERPMGGGMVWVSSGATERMVWSGEGNTMTLVSDAPDTTVEDAVLVLPHAPAVARDDGVLARTWRGMSRVGSWLNPFD